VWCVVERTHRVHVLLEPGALPLCGAERVDILRERCVAISLVRAADSLVVKQRVVAAIASTVWVGRMRLVALRIALARGTNTDY